MRYLKTSSLIYRCHDIAACIVAALIAMPVFGAILYVSAEHLLSGNYPATVYAPRGMATMLLMGVVGVAYIAKLFSDGRNHNPDETPFYRRNEDEQEYLSCILLPVTMVWFFAYFFSFFILYIPFAPIYIFHALRK